MSVGEGGPARFDDAGKLADLIVDKVGKSIVLALPLGLGKANTIANALYAKAVADRSIRLTIFTALTLTRPRAKSELEARFIGPLTERLFAGYPELDYAKAVRAGTVPPNVQIDEFFLQAGQWLDSAYAQQQYISANYTHALRYILDRGVNVVAQLVAHRPGEQCPFSFSCNPDIILDLLKLRHQGRTGFFLAGEVNSELPFMEGAAAVAESEFQAVLHGSDFPLFAPPREPVSLTDYAVGLHAASLVPDGGTLQIGIGALGDAVAQCLILRHQKNAEWRKLLSGLQPNLTSAPGRHLLPFESGVYGCTEMFVEGLLDLYRAGVLKRHVGEAVLHAGFFLGSRAFYSALREMPPEVRSKFQMTSISYVNELYGDEQSKRRERVNARFFNNAMMATVLGDVVSDGLEDGKVVSGVGGQYNFVSQAFALDGARSVIMLGATRKAKGKVQSNIRWRYGHVTIPRHLRDIVITEYGIADLRGKSDRDVIAAMLAVTDASFQEELLREARDAGKIERSFRLPDEARDNTPEVIERRLRPARDAGLLASFPFGSDFDEDERRLLPALARLKTASMSELVQLLLGGLAAGASSQKYLQRLHLATPKNPKEWIMATLVKGALRAGEH
jgi:acyl-CoA hydrolase